MVEYYDMEGFMTVEEYFEKVKKALDQRYQDSDKKEKKKR